MLPATPPPTGVGAVHQRPKPQSRRDEGRPRLRMPLVQRQAAARLVVPAHLATSERGERQRLGERPRPRYADRGELEAACRGEYRAAEESAGAPLIARHAVGREALHVLDVLVALAHAEAHVIGRHVVLQIDEGLAGGTHFP